VLFCLYKPKTLLFKHQFFTYRLSVLYLAFISSSLVSFYAEREKKREEAPPPRGQQPPDGRRQKGETAITYGDVLLSTH